MNKRGRPKSNFNYRAWRKKIKGDKILCPKISFNGCRKIERTGVL